MKLAELGPALATEKLAAGGLFLQTGPFVVHLHSPLAPLAAGVVLLYGDYDMATREDFADFHVRVGPPRNLRRWLRRQVLFSHDGYEPFLPLPHSQALPMLEWGLNWCVSNHAHQYLILHAAVVEKNGAAVLLPGHPGAGKSTLCAALVSRGWRLLSDEMAMLDARGLLQPMPRPISLKNVSIDVIRRFAPDVVIGPGARDTAKGTVAHVRAPAASVARWRESARPAWLVFPRYQAGAELTAQARERGTAALHLLEHAFNYSVLGLEGFRRLTRLMDAVQCYDFRYSRLEQAVAWFDALAADNGHGGDRPA